MPDLETIGKWAALIISGLTILGIIGKVLSRYVHIHDCGRLKEENGTLVKTIEAMEKLIEIKDRALVEVGRAIKEPEPKDVAKQTKEAMRKFYRDNAADSRRLRE